MKTQGTWRAVVPAMAVAVTVAAFLTGPFTETQAATTKADRACATAAWPYIPGHCLSGYAPAVDRVVTGHLGNQYSVDDVLTLNAGLTE